MPVSSYNVTIIITLITSNNHTLILCIDWNPQCVLSQLLASAPVSISILARNEPIYVCYTDIDEKKSE